MEPTLKKAKVARWIPLESNPEVLNKFVHSAGVPSTFGFADCFGLDEELLAMVPQPCLAVLLLFPPLLEGKKMKLEQQEKIVEEGQTISKNVYWMKQLVGNACGTIAVVHSILNKMDEIKPTGFLQEFYDETKDSDPLQKGEALGSHRGLEKIHEEVAHEGQTDAPAADSKVDYHFICFVQVEDYLYELDGDKAFPINHGPTTEDSFLKDAGKIIKTHFFEKAEPKTADLFSIITLGPLD